MPVPTFVLASRDSEDVLPDIAWRNETAAAKKMFDFIDQLGWVIDENPGAYLIAHNVPLSDAPIYIRVDSDEALLDSLLNSPFFGSETVAVVRVYTTLSDAQNETGQIGQALLPHSADANGADQGGKTVDFGWIGDSRTAYLIVAGYDEPSSLDPKYPVAKYAWYVFGEVARISGDPGCSCFGGGSSIGGDTDVQFWTGNDSGLRDGGLTNSLGSGAGFTDARIFSAGTHLGRLGEASGANADPSNPRVSPIYVRETTSGLLRGVLPGIVVPALGMGPLAEGIVEGIPFATPADSAVGLKVPSYERISRSDGPAWPVFADLSNDWDDYHAA